MSNFTFSDCIIYRENMRTSTNFLHNFLEYREIISSFKSCEKMHQKYKTYYGNVFKSFSITNNFYVIHIDAL